MTVDPMKMYKNKKGTEERLGRRVLVLGIHGCLMSCENEDGLTEAGSP